jgi:signal transduction histidine kinase
MLRSIRWKLALSLLLIVVVSVGLSSFLIGMGTQREFKEYVASCDQMYTTSVTKFLSDYYKTTGGWKNVDKLLAQQLTSADERLVLSDGGGIIVADTGGEWVGKNAKDVGLSQFVAVSNLNQAIGRLYPLSCDCSGIASSLGRSCSTTSIVYTGAEQDFLKRTNNYLWMIGLLTAAVALFLGWVLTRQITQPIHALKKGAQQLSSGEMNYRVPVAARDELGELAKSFNSMADSLDKMEQSRRHLTADIAHELRTPLTVIEGTVDGMLDGVFAPDKEHLNWIKEQTGLLTRLIEDLRDISQAEAGQLKLNIMRTNLVELIERKVSHLQIRAQEKEINLKLLTGVRVAEVEVDPVRMEQIVNNLLTNAIRHTPRSGNITVSVDKQPADNKYMPGKPGVLVSVADTGEGIPPEHLERIFDRFYRVESSRAKEEGETGLGLAIVKQMAEAHGGRVWAESTVGAGSTFFVFVPADKTSKVNPA